MEKGNIIKQTGKQFFRIIANFDQNCSGGTSGSGVGK